MKKLLLIATVLLCGFSSKAVNALYWAWGSMSPLNQYTTTEFCSPATAAVKVNLQYDCTGAPSPGPGRNFRANVELRTSGGASFNSGWIYCSVGWAAGSSGTYSQPLTTINVSTTGTYYATVTVESNTGGAGWVSYSSFTQSGGPIVTFKSPNTSFTYTVNGKKQTSQAATPPDILLCSGEELEIDGFTGLGTHTDIQTSMESGWYDPFAPEELRFIPNSSYISPFYAVVAVGPISLSGSLSVFRPYFWITPVRYVRVTVKVFGPCPAPGVWTTKVMIFKVTDAVSFVNFTLNPPSGAPCSSSLAPETTGSITPTTFTSPVPIGGTPPCESGWLGAGTCGIDGFTSTFFGTTPASYNIVVERISPSPTVLGTYGNTGGLPPTNSFNFVTSGHFSNPTNYAAEKGTALFKVTATVNTNECGPVSAFSYFKIIDGLDPNAIFYRSTAEDVITAMEKVTLFPNPAGNTVTVNWDNMSNASHATTLTFKDVFGKTVLSEKIQDKPGNNEMTFDISSLSKGMYFYSLKTSEKEVSGKMAKQ